MKEIFDAYVLWPFDKKMFFEFVTRVDTRNFTVFEFFTVLEIYTFGIWLDTYISQCQHKIALHIRRHLHNAFEYYIRWELP